jgi:hypothetical protein
MTVKVHLSLPAEIDHRARFHVFMLNKTWGWDDNVLAVRSEDHYLDAVRNLLAENGQV